METNCNCNDLEIGGGNMCITQNLDSNDLECDDLEPDCAPHFKSNFCHVDAHSFPQKGAITSPERYDSGIGDSFKSQDLGKQFQNMHLDSCVGKTSFCELTEESRVEPKQCLSTSPVVSQEDIVYEQDGEGDTQLHSAIIQEMPLLCLYFIKIVPHFGFLNLQNDLMQTVLHLAVMMKMTNIVRRLIVAGADVTFRDHRGDTPLHIASRNGDHETVRSLLEPVSYEETLQNSYKIPYQKIPQNLELRNYNGQTCLHVAAESSHFVVLKQLLSKGSDINTMDGKSGRTVLHYAAETNNTQLLAFLLQDYKVRVDARTYGGQTPLMLAQGRGHNAIVQMLLQAGAVFQLPREDSDSDDDMDESFS
ncbi:NF-kappa-B inhibitor cactus-like [Ylistrum balloti]|uniref:NF-kappa-B inhibitor cactus-like n=1 Tax=Ylistrum balloti TaxID=509963 RepID=UPI002905F160|nr:NF-kappa-B inhibitor cactus-like [Ylistrum balloti]